MKSIRFRQYGEPAKVLEVAERPVPEPGQEEARFPAPVGFEGVGIVDALGPGVSDLVPGQRVSVVNGQGGNWAEYALVPARDLIPVAADVPDEQVASFVINPASAVVMLRHVLAVPSGEWLLQSAAGSEI